MHEVTREFDVIQIEPAQIQTVYPGPVVRVRERERLQLECRAKGRPHPTISWTRQVTGFLIINLSIQYIDTD